MAGERTKRGWEFYPDISHVPTALIEVNQQSQLGRVADPSEAVAKERANAPPDAARHATLRAQKNKEKNMPPPHVPGRAKALYQCDEVVPDCELDEIRDTPFYHPLYEACHSIVYQSEPKWPVDFSDKCTRGLQVHRWFCNVCRVWDQPGIMWHCKAQCKFDVCETCYENLALAEMKWLTHGRLEEISGCPGVEDSVAWQLLRRFVFRWMAGGAYRLMRYHWRFAMVVPKVLQLWMNNKGLRLVFQWFRMVEQEKHDGPLPLSAKSFQQLKLTTAVGAKWRYDPPPPREPTPMFVAMTREVEM